jgi:hypothetical protein
MNRAIGVLLAASVLVSACTTPEEQARQRCASAADVAACTKADLERQRTADQRMMDDRNGMDGGMGGY